MLNLHIQKIKNNTAWIFPGQSSQKVGMGLDLLAYSFARAKFKRAEEILGWSVTEVCQDPKKLSRTLYTQPCLYVIETLLAELVQKEGYKPSIVAGYSLGEYAAIHTAGAFDFETGLHLIKFRAQLMDRSPEGRMVALIGCNIKEVETQIRHTPNVWRMNDDLNIAIISGTIRGVKSLLDKVEAKRIVPLKVSCAFHTPLMAEAAAEFQEIIESVDFKQLTIPMISSTELVPTLDIASLKNSLIQQMYQPVRWRAISLLLATQGIKEVVEIGPGKDLIKQMQRNCPQFKFASVNNPNTPKPTKQDLELSPHKIYFMSSS